MNLKDLIPSAEQVQKIQDVESALSRRRMTGNLAGIVALVSAVYQVIRILQDGEYLDKALSIVTSIVTLQFGDLAALDIKTDQLVAWVVLVFGLILYLVLCRTRLFLREAQEPFRYTFWIEKFQLVAETPGTRFAIAEADRMTLLHHDLTERLNQRIRRFSLIKTPQSGTADDDQPVTDIRGGNSHIDISGQWVVREDGDGNWLLQVTPTIRIGPPGRPARLATPIRFPLDRAEVLSEAGYRLSDKEYLQIVERVYSRIATDVYAQIESDVREKIKLYPTPRLRAIALYTEADDFAASNTVDAYQRAIKLYRDAMAYFDKMVVSSLSDLMLRLPWFWRFEIKFRHQWALMVAGYAKCLTYRRIMSALAGRDKNPIYELPELISTAVEPLEALHQKMAGLSEIRRVEVLQAGLHFPGDRWTRLLRGRVSRTQFEAQKARLVESYLVDGLSAFFLENYDYAEQRIRDARAVSPDLVATDPLYALMLALVEPIAEKRIVHNRRAVELAPDFQVARWNLARVYETQFRKRDDITHERAEPIIEQYEELLRINYGNISALSSQGFLLWLVGKLPEAKTRLEEGLEIKAVSGRTFVGELDYRLARIAAELSDFEDSYRHYMDAKEAEPAVGTYHPGETSRIDMSDYENIGAAMLERFRSYAYSVDAAIAELQKEAGNADPNSGVLDTVRCFVWNDYGNACLKYFHFRGDMGELRSAIDAYERAIAANPRDAVPLFNIQNAYSWNGQTEKATDCYEQARRLAPAWSLVAIAAARENVRLLRLEIQRRKDEVRDNEAEAARLGRSIGEAERKYKETSDYRLDFLIQSMAQRAAPSTRERLFTVDASAVAALASGSAGQSAAIRAMPDDLVQALRNPDLEEPLPEEDLFAKLEKQIGQSLTLDQKYAVRTQALKPLSAGEIRNWRSREAAEHLTDLAALESDLAEQIEAEKKQKETVTRNGVSLSLKLSTLEARFADSHKSALDVIASTSRLDSLFYGDLGERVARLAEIPWRKLDGQDVAAMKARAEVLASADDDAECLSSSIVLAYRLFTLMPGDHRSVEVLREALPKLIAKQQSTSAGNHRESIESLESKLQEVNAAWDAIVRRWVKHHSDNFLSLYWFLSIDDFTDEQSLQEVRERNYRGEPDQFESMLGHVYYTIGRHAKAAVCYRRAVDLNPDVARYHFYLSKAYSGLRDYKSARAAAADAYRLDPDNAAHAPQLALAYSGIGTGFFDKGAYRDALDNYEQASKLTPEHAAYHSYRALALNRLADNAAKGDYRAAIAAGELACKYDPDNAEYARSLEKLQRKQAAFDTYGTAPIVRMYTMVTPIAVEYSANLDVLVRGDSAGEVSDATRERVDQMRRRLQDHYGVPIPNVRWRANDGVWGDGHYVLMLDEVPIVSGHVSLDQKFCPRSVEALAEDGIASTHADDPLTGESAAWISDADSQALFAQGVELLDPVEYLLRHLEALITDNLVGFVGHQEVINLLNTSGAGDVSRFQEDAAFVDGLTEVLRALVAERVPIAAFVEIVRRYAGLYEERKSVVETVETMRLLPVLRERLPGNNSQSTFFGLGERFEAALRENLVHGDGVSALAISPEECQEMLAAVRDSTAGVRKAALVTSSNALRPHLRSLVKLEFPHVQVLARPQLREGLEARIEKTIEMSPVS